MLSKPAIQYIKFLELSESLDNKVISSLEIEEVALLNYLSLAWSSHGKISVVDAMHGFPKYSIGTVHRYLKGIRKKGLITLHLDEVDNRIKYILPTDLTDKYFSHLGQCLAKAVAT